MLYCFNKFFRICLDYDKKEDVFFNSCCLVLFWVGGFYFVDFYRGEFWEEFKSEMWIWVNLFVSLFFFCEYVVFFCMCVYIFLLL